MGRTQGIECDRCHKLIASNGSAHWPKIAIREYIEGRYLAQNQLDICPECLVEFNVWVGDKNERNETRDDQSSANLAEE